MPEYTDKAARLAFCRRKFAMCNARSLEHQRNYDATHDPKYRTMAEETEEDAEYWKNEMAKVRP